MKWLLGSMFMQLAEKKLPRQAQALAGLADLPLRLPQPGQPFAAKSPSR